MPKDTVWFRGHPDRATLCLRVCGDDLDPDLVTRILGVVPSRSQRKGQPVLSSAGEPKRIARTGSWLLARPVSHDRTLDDEIESLLDSLPQTAQTWATLRERYRVDLICDVFVRGVNQGFELSPRVLELMGRFGISLGIDIFCEPDDALHTALNERLP
jgi:Domain of unknown function (DUF4279)